MKKIILSIGSIVLLSLSSCTISQQFITTGNPVGTKVGVATAKTSDLDSDFTIQSAAKKGGITKIATVDVVLKSYIFYIKGTTTVTGE